jgi:predicted SAM-dependent methyltransferase
MEMPVFSTRKLLNLGCGARYHPEWVNVDFTSTGPDVIACNLNAGLPFDKDSFDVVYHSHLLEHFPKRHALTFMKECSRVLKPGGIVRVVVPDLEQLARIYLQLLDKAAQGDVHAGVEYGWIVIEMLDQMVRDRSGGEMLRYWKQNPMPAEKFVIERTGSEVLNALKTIRSVPVPQEAQNDNASEGCTEGLTPEKVGCFRLSGEVHQWMYDRYSLAALLRDAGFSKPHICAANKSAIPDFNRYLLDVEADGAVRKPDSLFMEAEKLPD